MRFLRRALFLLLFVVACEPERQTARIQGFDALAPAGVEVTLAAKVEADDMLGLHGDLHGVPLLFKLAGKEIAKATTGSDGLASAHWTPPGEGVHELMVEVAAKSRHRGSATLRVFVRSRERPVLVVDLDGTVCGGSSIDVIRKEPTEVPVIADAPAVLTRLAARYDILYLTGRDDALISRSREWLDCKGFPRGPLLVRDLKLSTLSAEKYKKERLKRLATTWKLVAGVGDRDEDESAYRSVGMRSFLVPHHNWKQIEEALSAPPAPADGPPGPGAR